MIPLVATVNFSMFLGSASKNVPMVTSALEGPVKGVIQIVGLVLGQVLPTVSSVPKVSSLSLISVFVSAVAQRRILKVSSFSLLISFALSHKH